MAVWLYRRTFGKSVLELLLRFQRHAKGSLVQILGRMGFISIKKLLNHSVSP